MAKDQPAKPNKSDKADADESPYAGISRQLRRLSLLAYLWVVVSLGLLVASIWVVIYDGKHSMLAFEDLPQYRVNKLAIGYRDAVRDFDQSMHATEEKLSGAGAQLTVQKARQLAAQLVASEQAFDQLLAAYGEAMGLGSEQFGGALEWNRYFQADIQSLRDDSAKRLLALQAIYTSFPEANLPAAQTAAASDKISRAASVKAKATGKN